jgi:NAD(P)-dependent dehydrogenase (short-subunit alcohol dehydrogenase family)
VGPGTGAAIVRRFARGGYSVAMLARTIADNAPLSLAGMKATILRAIF